MTQSKSTFISSILAKFGEIITTLANFMADSFIFMVYSHDFTSVGDLYIINMKESAIKWAKVVITSPNLASMLEIGGFFDCAKNF